MPFSHLLSSLLAKTSKITWLKSGKVLGPKYINRCDKALQGSKLHVFTVISNAENHNYFPPWPERNGTKEKSKCAE